MRIAVCFDDKLRPDSTGVYFLSALRDLGHTVDHWTSDRALEIHGNYDFYLRVDDGIPWQVSWNPSLHPSAYYVIDTHIETDWRIEMANRGKFDFVCCCQKGGLSLGWQSPTLWTPAACDPKRHHVGKRDKKYDICFIGNFHSQFWNKRIRIIDEAFRVAPNFFYGTRTFEEMAEKYAESRIIINQSLNNDINMRFYESMCSGSALLTDKIEEMDEIGLYSGKHFFSFSKEQAGVDAVTSGELKDTINYLLNDSKRREEVAEAGMKEVMKNHTYVDRCRIILNKLEEIEEIKCKRLVPQTV